MKRALLIFATIALGCVIRADDTDYARRISCELQTAGTASLPALEFSQGTTPLIAADQYRSGRAITVTNDTIAYFRFAPSMTNAYWVSTSNTSFSGNSFYIQLPSIGTNATGWVYTVIYEKNGNIYWTGSGRLTITASTVTGSQLAWQQMTGAITSNTVNSLIATHNASTASHADKLTTNATLTINGETKRLTDNPSFTVTGGSGITAPEGTNIAESVVGQYTNAIATAWQNPASATNWTWTSDGSEITLTGYTGPNDVVIPDMLDGLPVTKIGVGVFGSGPPEYTGTGITSVSGAENIKQISDYAFNTCLSLSSISFPSVVTIGASAFSGCTNLTTVLLPSTTTILDGAFLQCSGLTSISLENVSSIGPSAFDQCGNLTSVYWKQNQPTDPPWDIYFNSPSVTNYVANPTAQNWGATFGGRPVVRMPIESEDVKAGTVITIGSITAPSINFTNGTSLTWNPAEEIQSLEYTHPDGGTVTVNGEIYAMWKNIDDVAITNGQPVCLQSGAGRVGSIKLAEADDPSRNGMIGFYTGDAPLAIGAIGRITTFGIVRDAPLNSIIDGVAPEGAQLYLSSVRGHVTTNLPVAPAETIKVGFLNYAHVPSNKYDIQVAIENAKPWSVLDGRYTTPAAVTNIVVAAGYLMPETVVTGAVRTVSSGNRYFFTTPSNVILSASLTAGQVVNYVAIRNTTNAPITAIAESSGWVWTGGGMTNTIPTNSMMTFGFACNPITGRTNAYATAASVN